jgi:hypothetical protein
MIAALIRFCGGDLQLQYQLALIAFRVWIAALWLDTFALLLGETRRRRRARRKKEAP